MKMISYISLVEMQHIDHEVVRARFDSDTRLSGFHQIPDLFRYLFRRPSVSPGSFKLCI